MPWTEVKPMQQKILFIADYLRSGHSFSELCRIHGISRKTGYKWVERYETTGPEGLIERTHKTENCPHKTPYAIRKAIIELRLKGRPAFGAKKIHALLIQRYSALEIPSRTTINNILREEGHLKARKTRQRVPRHNQPMVPPKEANELWTADFKGQFLTGSSEWCYPLTVMDQKSRYLLGCRGLKDTKTENTKREFEKLFREYGLPERIRTDNGVPFASRSVGGLSALSIWWIKLGIIPERIEPGKPQQNGCHERMHKTLKEATASPPAKTGAEQQKRFEAFCEQYNHERPHESLGQTPPAMNYVKSSRQMPKKLPATEYPGYMRTCRVAGPGMIYLGNKIIYAGHLLRGEILGLEEIDEGLWDVYFGPVRIGNFDERQKGTGEHGYLTLTCNLST